MCHTLLVRPVQYLAATLSVLTYRKSLLLYSGANSRVVRLSIGHWYAMVEVSCGVLRTREQTRPFSYKNGTYPAAKRPARWKIRYEETLRKQAALFPQHVPSPTALTNIFKPRANQVSDQVRQTRDRSSGTLYFVIYAQPPGKIVKYIPNVVTYP